MPAFVLVDVTIDNPEEFEEYKKLTPATLAAFNGKFIARGGQTITLEGEWNPNRITLIEFPTIEQAKAWWSSDLYALPKAMRQRAAKTKMIIVEGIS